MMTQTREQHVSTYKKANRKPCNRIEPYADSPKELYANSRDGSGREYIKPNLPRIVLDDVKKASHSSAQSGVVWFGFQTPFGVSASKEFAVSVLHGEAVKTVCVRIVADAKVFREFEHTPASRTTIGYSQVVESEETAREGTALKLCDSLMEMERKSGRDKALDLLYDTVDSMYRDGHIAELNKLLSAIPAQMFSIHLLLGFLTATLPFQSKLSARKELRRRVEETLRQRGEYRDSLLSGL